MSKKYCIFSAQYLPHMGGVENYTYHLAKELVGRGHSVTVVTCNVENVKTYDEQEGIKIYRMPCVNFIDGRFPVLKFNRTFCKIHRIISQQPYDMVIVNTRFYIHSLYGAFFGRKHADKMIFIEHGTGHLTLHNPVLDFLENIVEHTMTFIEKMLCQDFYGVSEACLEWLQHFHINGKGVLYNSIDLQIIDQQLENPVCSYREQYQVPLQADIVCFTGRLLKEKGVITLIHVFNEICEHISNVYLFVAGDGAEYEYIQKIKNDRVFLLGRITPEKVTSLLRESDIFCLPSDSEGMPTSVLEAAACRNFIVTTKQGGAKELVLDESYGIITEDNSYRLVKQALEQALKDPTMRKAAGKKVRERVASCFTWEEVAKKIEKI